MNPVTGIFIQGMLVGALVETSGQNNQYTNYRMGIAVESKPDSFGQVATETKVINLSKDQFERFKMTIDNNLRKPVKIAIDIYHRAGEKNGRVWEVLDLAMRPHTEIEFLQPASVTSMSASQPETIKKS